MTGMSKPFGLGGLRIGWLATKSDDMRTAVRQYRYNTAEMTNTPCQWLACRALQKSDEILTRNRKTITANLDRLAAFVETHNDTLSLFRPKAGTMQGQRTLTPLWDKDLEQEVVVPSAMPALHGNAFFAGMLLQER